MKKMIGKWAPSGVKLDAAVFDLFQTLVYFENDRHPHKRLFKRLGLSKAEAARARSIAMTNQFGSLSYLAERLKPGCNVNCADLEEMILEDIALVKLYPETIDVLDKLGRRGVRLGLISNLSSPYCSVLDDLDIEDFFDEVIFSCDAGMVKPNPGLYQLMIARLGIEAGRIIMTGDQKSKDCDAPKAAGMHGVHLDRSGIYPGSIDSLERILEYF